MNEKINPELELAIETRTSERSGNLYLGYDSVSDSWTLIIRYSGDIEDIRESLLNSCVTLLGGFAVINIYTANIELLQRDPRILYIDKSNYYSYGSLETVEPSDASVVLDLGTSYDRISACVTENFTRKYGLTGKGVYVGIVDSRLAVSVREFQSVNGETRIESYWDQNAPYSEEHSNRYGFGRIYDSEEPEVLSEQTVTGEAWTPYASHGTEVASVAAGTYVGIAPGTSIIAVGMTEGDGVPDTISIMTGIDYLVRYVMDRGAPMVLNLSYGNNYGAHDGTGILELFIDAVSQMAKISVITGTGNDGSKGLHTSGILGNVTFADLDISVSYGTGSFGVQIWKSYADNMDVIVYSPSYNIVIYLTEGQIVTGNTAGATYVSGIFQPPSPYSVKQLVYVYFKSAGFIEEGVWRVRLIPKSIVNGVYNAYLPGDNYVTGRVMFSYASTYGSLTIPSTSESVISVAAYNQSDNSLVGFSGRGYTADNMIKPDIAAPGVDITAAAPDGGYVAASGTSVSAAYVSGCAALLMEWGIVRGNDFYMYGERLKAQLIRGAKPLATGYTYPNRYVGWGLLCMEKSIPL